MVVGARHSAERLFQDLGETRVMVARPLGPEPGHHVEDQVTYPIVTAMLGAPA